ncbi:cupin domain-containing protein [Hymenobacter sp. UV11]|uniref:cupin domain-containing protein n=1 Tax=Hymenobacter sp. UV11 TaxID=1849735 RepID=UPI00105B99CE|nr:cupin domain-containing protein [Hymenobacter sp. UV11]TDN35852.1 cupin [Hymenobacter sp. UV11]TFZ67462.1 cupin domain-containing protein [Hymenobacter sp. UV11]
MRPTSIRTLAAQAGPSLSVVGDTYRIVTSGEQTSGAYAIIDMLVPPGGGPGPHAHTDIQEAFYVIAGEVVVRSETQTYTARQGDFVDIPKGGAVHSFTNESDAVAHLLCVVVPAGLEKLFEEIGQPVAAGEFLPQQEPTPSQLQQMQAAAERHGQELFPPDYLKK